MDLRHTTLFLQDGSTSTLTGTIGGATGYSYQVVPRGLQTRTLPVTFSTAPPPGTLIQIGGNLQYYEIEAATTTSMTIFPDLCETTTQGMTITVLGNGIYAKIGEGNLTYSEKQNLVYIRDRGFIDTIKLGDQDPVDVSIDFTWEFLRGFPDPVSSTGVVTQEYLPSFEEALKQIGDAANWVSSSIDPCEPYSVEIVIMDVPACLGVEKILLSQFRWTALDHDLKAAKVSVKGSCNVAYATVTHLTA